MTDAPKMPDADSFTLGELAAFRDGYLRGLEDAAAWLNEKRTKILATEDQDLYREGKLFALEEAIDAIRALTKEKRK